MGNPGRSEKKTKENNTRKPDPADKPSAEPSNLMLDNAAVVSDSNQVMDFYDLILVGMVVHDKQGNIILANPAAERILGLTGDEKSGRKIINPQLKFIHEDGSDFPAEQIPFNRVLETGESVNDVPIGVFNLINEKCSWILVNSIPAFLPGQNKPYQVITSFTDTTNLRNVIDTFGKYETLLNLAMVATDLGIWKQKIQTQQFFLDETSCRHFGLSSGDITAREILDIIHPDDAHRIAAESQAFIEQRETDSARTEFRVVQPDGTIKWLAINAIIQFVESESGQIQFTTVGTSQDITERKLAEEALRRKTRAFFVLSSCDQALVKVSNEIDLLQEICRICVEDGDYRMAWIGYIDNGPDKKIQPVAQSGFEEGYLDSANITWADIEQGRGPTGTAVRTNRPSISQNIQEDPRTLPWREAAANRGYASSIALPIHVGGNVIGVFTLYAHSPEAFKSDEVNLLSSLTDDLSFSIEALRARAAQNNLQEALRKSEERYKLAQQSAHIGSWEWDMLADTMFWSDEMFILFDKKPDEFSPTYAAMMSRVLVTDRLHTALALDESAISGIPFDVEFRVFDSAGQIKWINSKGIAYHDDSGQSILASGTMQDITQRKQIEEDLHKVNRNYKLISENSEDVIWVLDVKMEKFTFISPSIKKLLGYTVEEMIQLSLKDILTPESYERSKIFLTNNIPDNKEGKSTTSFILELDQVRKEKLIVCTEVTSTQVYDDEGYLHIICISRDITDRKRSEAILKEERNLFQVLMNNIPDAIYFKNLKSRFIRINKSEAEVFGLKDPSQVVGKTDFNFFTEQHARQAFNDEQNIIRSGQPLIDFEEKESFADGHTRWISTSKLPFRNNAGEIIGTFGISHDITRRKQMELSLQQRIMELETVHQLSIRVREGDSVQEILQVLLDDTLKTIDTRDGGIFLFEPSSKKLELSAARGWFENLAGLSLEPNEGLNGHVFTTNQPYISTEMHDDQLLAQRVKELIPKEICGGFFPIRCEEGIIGVLDVYVPLPRTISDNEQRLLSIISQLAGNAILRSRLNEKLKLSNVNLQEEVDQRIAFQAMLAKEKELLTTTLMSLGEGVIITDKDGFILLFNRSAESLTGYKAVEVINQPLHNIFRLINPITQKIIPDLIRVLYEMGRGQSNDPNYKTPLLIRKSGERIVVTASISLLKPSDGEMMGHVIVFQNITEKQKAEAQSALSQKMEAIGQLAAGIAHEINTPIQYIGDNLRFLQKTISKFTEVLNSYQKLILDPGKPMSLEEINILKDVEKQTKIHHYLSESPSAVQEALDGVERVRKIVLAMREFSHPSEKAKKLSDINHGIETTIVISRNEWKYLAELETDFDPELPMVNCQIDEINQVILNMIVNAVQSIQEKIPEGSDQKGKITISTRKDQNKIHIKVQDTGKGIPKDIQQRIFDPFFTTKGVGKGTGQGLSLAHSIIVKEHQGSISVNSVEGEGTIFTIELPINSSEKES